ncbi:uncharacterized protein IUM83_04911 [Phytophthora cinnamomi]|uniref:uncharacterized protein n=1 Tax=Phytophthora cinnamomi TaxID=4785 RepID=UPI00355AA1EA|nr:hypothetical protein IUM83_04911 [Phytophthora cinnamomi]
MERKAAESKLSCKLSRFVFEELCERVPGVREGGVIQLLEIDEADAANKKLIDAQFSNVAAFIIDRYRLQGGEILMGLDIAKLLAQLQLAIKATYVNAHVKFHAYLARVWSAYENNRSSYLAPCVALVQSSGFGTSRMLNEVAKMMADDSAVAFTDPPLSNRVLYVCTRDGRKSSGFPLATPELASFFFGDRATEEDLISRLPNAWKHAPQPWDETSRQWVAPENSKPILRVLNQT